MRDLEQQEIEDRRKFLISAGRFAAVTPPAMTLFLSTSLTPMRSPGLTRKAMAGRAITAAATAVATAPQMARMTRSASVNWRV
jgi:hypothetical protein